ncbi:MalM family protein [Psychromonas sp. MME1]|uniref:MalM family protein n=1 Tax=Psychromonas sp. MME1 TaxID=3231032 RepID=UPI0034E2A526
MVIRQSSVILLTSLLLASCSNYSLEATQEANTNAFQPIAKARNELANKTVCCTTFQQLKYKEIKSDGPLSIAITDQSQAYNFANGKSFVEAYKITSKSQELRLEMDSLIFDSVLMPEVTLLDANFKVTRTIKARQFIYKEAKVLKGDRLFASLTIYRQQANNPANETYILFHTSPENMKGGTTIIHPAKAFAIAHSTVPPEIPDPIIPHSATGLIELNVASKNTTTDSENGYNPLANLLSIEPKSESISEQDAHYNTEILAAIADNEISRALTLVHEAESIGSTTARTTFTDALKKRNETVVLSEQEYNQEIIDAISVNEIAKALALVDQAEAAGSPSARQTFLDALDNNKTPQTRVEVKKDINQQIKDAVAAKQTAKALQLVNKAESEGSTTARKTFVDALKARDGQ